MPSHFDVAKANVAAVSKAYNDLVDEGTATLAEHITVTRLTIQLAHVAEMRAANRAKAPTADDRERTHSARLDVVTAVLQRTEGLLYSSIAREILAALDEENDR